MVIFALGGCGIWIPPLLFLAWLVHRPVDQTWRGHFASAVPRFRVRPVRLISLMAVVFVAAIDSALVVTSVPGEAAVVIIAADLTVIGVLLLIDSLFALSPPQLLALGILLAFAGLMIGIRVLHVIIGV